MGSIGENKDRYSCYYYPCKILLHTNTFLLDYYNTEEREKISIYKDILKQANKMSGENQFWEPVFSNNKYIGY